MSFFKSLGLAVQFIPYPSAEQHEHTLYRVVRARQINRSIYVNEYGTIAVTVYGVILYIRNVDVPVRHRDKGIARALLQYVLEDQMKRYPNITVSELDDHSDRPWDGPGNLYYSFGYRLKPDSNEEKILDLTEYKLRI